MGIMAVAVEYNPPVDAPPTIPPPETVIEGVVDELVIAA